MSYYYLSLHDGYMRENDKKMVLFPIVGISVHGGILIDSVEAETKAEATEKFIEAGYIQEIENIELVTVDKYGDSWLRKIRYKFTGKLTELF